MDCIQEQDRVGIFLRDLAGIILGCGTYVQADGPDMAPQSFHEVGPKAIIPPQGVSDAHQNDLALQDVNP